MVLKLLVKEGLSFSGSQIPLVNSACYKHIQPGGNQPLSHLAFLGLHGSCSSTLPGPPRGISALKCMAQRLQLHAQPLYLFMQRRKWFNIRSGLRAPLSTATQLGGLEYTGEQGFPGYGQRRPPIFICSLIKWFPTIYH